MIKQLPRISVVIPLYNKAAHIEDTLKTVLNQTFQPDRIIVVDDGSNDGGPEIVESLDLENLILIRQRNAGVSAARNRGIEVCTTDLVALIDADDQWAPHFLEEIVKLYLEFPAAGIFASNYQYKTKSDYFNPRLATRYLPKMPGLISDYFKAMAYGDLPVTMSSVVISKQMYNRIGGFPVGEPMGEDQDFLFRAALHAPMAYTPKVLAFYLTETENRACVRNIPDQECAFSRRLATLADLDSTPVEIKDSLQLCRTAHLFHLVKRNYEAGRFETAARLINHPSCRRNKIKSLFWHGLTRYKLGSNSLNRYVTHLFNVFA